MLVVTDASNIEQAGYTYPTSGNSIDLVEVQQAEQAVIDAQTVVEAAIVVAQIKQAEADAAQAVAVDKQAIVAVKQAEVDTAEAIAITKQAQADALVALATVSTQGDTLAVTQATATNGSVIINDDSTLTYQGNPDFNGIDTITYTVSDGELTDTATVTVEVAAVNDQTTSQC